MGRHPQTFYKPFEKDLVEAEKKMRDIKSQEEKTDEVCEKCNQPMIIKWGRFGKFMACSNYPECKNTKEVGGKDEGPDAVKAEGNCDKCNSPLVIKVGRFGKFMACSAYPDCKFTKPISSGFPARNRTAKKDTSPHAVPKKDVPFTGAVNIPTAPSLPGTNPLRSPARNATIPTWFKSGRRTKGKVSFVPNVISKSPLKPHNS